MSEMTSMARDFSHYIRHPAPGLDRMELAVEGMNCAGCMSKIERGLKELPQITLARANLTDRRVALEWNSGTLDPSRVVDRLTELGYKSYPFEVNEAEKAEAERAGNLLRYLGVAAFAAMNVMMLSVPIWTSTDLDMTWEQRDFFHWLSAVIALPAAVYAGQPFFRSALSALRAKQTNMDVPISIGIVLAMGISLVETYQHAEHAYFDAVLMLIAFLLAGRYLDQKMRLRVRAVAANLTALKAETAAKMIGEGEVREVPIAAVQAGDIILLRPGERCGVDAVVIDGCSDVDQSLVTGESRPARVEQGAVVYSGTLNLSGALRLRVTEPADTSLLAGIERLLDNANQARSRYVRLADRASRVYAPVVHAVALVTMIGWVLAGASWHDAIVIAISVLIITCPCALGLAIPAVQTVASGAMFKSGLLLQSGDAIERLAACDTVVFDKTGTLTSPELDVANARMVPDDVLALAGRLALTSGHPMAAAVARATKAQFVVPGAREIAGQGVVADMDGREIRLGSPAFCDAQNVADEVARSEPDASIVAFADGDARYALAVRQLLREGAAGVVADLQREGLSVEIMSGDRESAVRAAANALNVRRWRAGTNPAEKFDAIEEMKGDGRRILMVGDGVNDAPALAAAHASIAPITASHLSQNIADIVFLGGRLDPLVAAIRLARKARRLMSQNLWLAVGYNLLAVPIAIAGLTTPLVAALAMSGSSLIVIMNALRGSRADAEGAAWKF